MKYIVEIKETLNKQIEVTANSPDEAAFKAEDLYKNETIVLLSDDIEATDFTVLSMMPTEKD